MRRFFVILTLTFALTPGILLAQSATDLALPEQSDVRIIVDISGSMKDTDPNNLRQPAVRLLARMLPEGTTAGVWTFGQYVNMLVPHREVDDPWRESAIIESAKINSVALRTNLGKAIEVASDDYFTKGKLDNTHFILLTDGNVDISDNSAANREEEARILNEVVPGLIARGATFHPVALSDQADANFLKQLADRSGGRFQVAANADALSRAFLEALNAAVPQEQIPLEGNTFTVDGGVEEFTALVFWGQDETRDTREMALIEPDGTTYTVDSSADKVRWARESGYDLVTINKPASGTWSIEGELGEGSRVTVVSDLRMVVSPLPPNFSEENPVELSVAFFEENEKITSPDFLGVINVSLTITAEDGRSGSKALSDGVPPEDGVYTDTIAKLPAAGLYKIDVIADGKTFARKFSTTTGFTVPEAASEVSPAVVDPVDEEPVAEEPAVEQPPEPEPEIPAPIDVSQVEEAVEQPATPEQEEPAASEEDEKAASELPFPLWVPIAAGGVLLTLVVVWFALKQRKSRAEAQEKAAADRETVEDLEEELPTIDEEVPEDLVEPEPQPESEPEPEMDVVTEEKAVPEALPEEGDESDLEAVFDEVEEEIPVADSVVEPEPEVVEEDIPELEPEATDEPEDASEADMGGDEEEFGLEDFDLSEFDDLPDYEEDDGNADKKAATDQTNPKDQKK
ncbi:VWA domain-containing protein [Marinobacter nitratireducens]|nr:vWA domain-containing protein [Marinobacter nitratireducens]